MAKSHTYHMFPFEDRPPPLLCGSDTCSGKREHLRFSFSGGLIPFQHLHLHL